MNKQGGLMNTELIKALKEDAEWAHANEWETPITLGDHLDAAASALKTTQSRANQAGLNYQQKCRDISDLEAQLAESQRRERAAVEDLELNAACPCRVCKNSKCYRRNGRENCKFEWRGPQAGKGEAE
jgi:hypothetical protein